MYLLYKSKFMNIIKFNVNILLFYCKNTSKLFIYFLNIMYFIIELFQKWYVITEPMKIKNLNINQIINNSFTCFENN